MRMRGTGFGTCNAQRGDTPLQPRYHVRLWTPWVLAVLGGMAVLWQGMHDKIGLFITWH